MPSSKTRVAIIGGGVAGLVAARHVASKPENYSLTLFEQTNEVGGTWVYTDDIDYDKNGLRVHSSMYKNLRTNLPKEIMQIPDFPFQDKDGPSYVHHSVIRQYLLDYAKHFNLFPHIKLNTLVKRLEPETLPGGQTVWTITSFDVQSNTETVKTYDAVLLCNGRYTVGNIPRINGRETFPGESIHSHQYRTPEKYAGSKVCILGASWSGIDIALEVANYAEKIYLSHDLPEPLDSKLPPNVEQTRGIVSISGNTFVFRDGSTAEVDYFIYCTGYKFTYPFMSDKIRVTTEDNNVEPLYKNIIYPDLPNLFFMVIPGIVIAFPMVNVQAQYVLAVLEGRIVLPPPDGMREECRKEKEALLNQGILARHINRMGARQWAYYDELCKASDAAPFLPVVKKIYDHASDLRELDFTTYKHYQYRIVDKNNFNVTYCKPC